MSAKPAFWRRGRKATPQVLRVLATLVALLLSISSLGQVAHFVLIQHAICAEHGELLELEQRPTLVSVAHEHEAGDKTKAHVSSSEAAGHDHCEILARSQKQQGLPPAPALGIAPAAAGAVALNVGCGSRPLTALPRLAVAPKTSPPCVSQV